MIGCGTLGVAVEWRRATAGFDTGRTQDPSSDAREMVAESGRHGWSLVSVVRDGNVIDGRAVSSLFRAKLRDSIEVLEAAGVRPTLATVLMDADPASESYMAAKRQACEELGVEGIHRSVPPDAPAESLYDTIEGLSADAAVDGVFVQLPVPDHVDTRQVRQCLDPAKDVDGFHPTNVGRLVAGEPRFKPPTPHAIQVLLSAAGVDTAGKDAVLVGRSAFVGTPMANLLLSKSPGGNATTTVCHTRTADLAAKTRQADILVVAAGEPELVDGSMIAPGAVVVDVSANRVETASEGVTIVGDVAFESAREKASLITPVPGGVGPMTITMLLYNTVTVASQRAGVDVDLPRPVPFDLAD